MLKEDQLTRVELLTSMKLLLSHCPRHDSHKAQKARSADLFFRDCNILTEMELASKTKTSRPKCGPSCLQSEHGTTWHAFGWTALPRCEKLANPGVLCKTIQVDDAKLLLRHFTLGAQDQIERNTCFGRPSSLIRQSLAEPPQLIANDITPSEITL